MSQHKDDRVRELFEWIKADAERRGDYQAAVDGMPVRAERLCLVQSSTLYPTKGVRDFVFEGSHRTTRHDDDNGWQLI